MTNLKKTLAVVLAFAMILSMGAISTFAAYSDVESGTVVSEAVGILSNLNILTGFEDGTFRPDETVTRAQMAAIICRTLGYEDQAQSSMGSTVFNDVAADHWASGYINVAQAQGIINGYGDGNFGPEDQVTYEQAVKMLVSALGYDLAAQTKGGYPTGYLAIASTEGITKNANGKVGDAAKRSAIAVLVYNSLEVRLMDQSSWTTNNEDEYKKTDDTILSKYLEVEKWEGIVTRVPLMDAAVNGYDADAAKEISIYGNYSVYYSGKLTDYYTDDTTKRADASLVNAEDFLGKSVVAYIGAEEDDETGNIMVYAIAEAKNKNEVTSISGVQLVESTDSEWAVDGQISYRKTGSTKVYDLDLATDVEVFENFEASNLDETAATADYAAAVANGGRLELISNDTDDAIEYILITAYEYEAVIEEVVEEEGIYSFELYKGDLDEVDTEDENELVVVYIDGVMATVADLAEGYTVSTAEVGNDVRVLYASTKSVTGTVDGYDSDENTVSIANVDYDLSPLGSETIAANLKDEEGIFYLNVDGEIAHNESEATGNAKYALVLAISYESGITDGYVAQVVTADGTVTEYNLDTKAKFNGSGDDQSTAIAIAKAIDDAASELGTTWNTASVYKTDYAKAVNAIFEITIKDSEITKVKTLEGRSQSYADTRTYDAESMTYGSAEFDDATLVFALDQAEDYTTTEVKDDDVSVGGVADFFADGDGYNFYTLDVDDDVAPLVLGFEMSSSIPDDAPVVVVTGKKTVTYDDDDAVQITGFQDGEEISVIIYDENNGYTTAPENLAKGDVILLGNVNAEGVTDDCQLLLDMGSRGAATLSAAAIAGDAKDEIAHAYGLLDKEYTTSSKFVIDSNVEYKGAPGDVIYLASEGIPMRQSARYTLVDYTESTTNPEVSRKGASSSLFSTNSKYDTFVFVRVYDGALTDVVVYRYNAGTTAAGSLAAPVITIDAATDKASITADAGADVMVKVNDGEYELYTDAISVVAGDVISAYATKALHRDSTVTTVTVAAADIAETLEAPTITVAAGTATIEAAAGATIMVKVNDANFAEYTTVTGLVAGDVIKAYATQEGYNNSEEASHTVTAEEATVVTE